ncbi:DNA/RNA nuclease SfsA [Candidatus Bathyarchaeota archaeon]|nr:DNA/RNA nuclease SfsA [Candidatus Bathyarchaeota archaeon]
MTTFVEIKGNIVKGVFKKRLTRFSARVEVDGKIVECFLPNPGRLSELLFSGVKVALKEAMTVGFRKTVYDLVGVYHGGRVVSVDARVPNKLVFEALKNGDLPEFSGYKVIKPEHSYGRAKFDFFLEGFGLKPCLLEVKSCTLVRDGVAMFPDAPTARGARHVLELIKALEDGYRAAVLFIVQRDGAYRFTANDATDPKFGRALREAYRCGVEVYAYSASFVKNRVWLNGKVEVVL